MRFSKIAGVNKDVWVAYITLQTPDEFMSADMPTDRVRHQRLLAYAIRHSDARALNASLDRRQVARVADGVRHLLNGAGALPPAMVMASATSSLGSTERGSGRREAGRPL